MIKIVKSSKISLIKIKFSNKPFLTVNLMNLRKTLNGNNFNRKIRLWALVKALCAEFVIFIFGVIIFSFLFSKMNHFQALQKRELSRNSMQYLKSGWGYIHYGNSGDVEFISHNATNYKISRYEKFKKDEEDF